MNKRQLIEAVATEMGTPKAVATRAINAVINSITQGIQDDSTVTIAGFGTFSKKNRAPRTVNNPATGEPMQIKASKTVNFKASDSLKKSLAPQGDSAQR